MNQVTEKGGRLGHFLGSGEGILKQKAAPGFPGISWFITRVRTHRVQDCVMCKLSLITNEMQTPRKKSHDNINKRCFIGVMPAPILFD